MRNRHQDPMPNTDAERPTAYWRKTRRLTLFLLAVWFLTTFLSMYFARELSSFTIAGAPFSFYMAAQGLTLLYFLLVAVYVIAMRQIDQTEHKHDDV